MNTMIKKVSTGEILNHWILALSCILLIVTGYAFLFQIKEIGSVFGGFNGMRAVHNWAGVVFTASLFATLFNYLHESISLTSDDWNWIKMGGGYLSKQQVSVPPMGKLNTGQKLYYLMVLGGGLAIGASGFAIWLIPGSQALTQASHLVHNLAFILFVVGVPAHIYLGTLANPGTFRIMVYGTVPIEFARKKYPKWMKEMGMQ